MLRTHSAIPEIAVDPSARWDDPGNDPLALFQQARLSVFACSQRRANTVVLPYKVFDVVRNHPKVVERIRYSVSGVLNEDLLAQLLDVDRVLVPRAFKNVSAKGKAAVCEPIWGNEAFMLYVPPRPALKQVAVAYTFVWAGIAGSVDGSLVERWREARRKADMIRVQKYYDHKLIAPGAAFRLLDVIA
jgi:hypothetical protein